MYYQASGICIIDISNAIILSGIVSILVQPIARAVRLPTDLKLTSWDAMCIGKDLPSQFERSVDSHSCLEAERKGQIVIFAITIIDCVCNFNAILEEFENHAIVRLVCFFFGRSDCQQV